MKWTENYGIYKATCGVLDLTCAWQRGAYTVTVNGRVLKKAFGDVEEAQAAAVWYGRKLLAETILALDTLEEGVSNGQ